MTSLEAIVPLFQDLNLFSQTQSLRLLAPTATIEISQVLNDASSAIMLGVSALIYFKEIKYYKDLAASQSTSWSGS
jgi:hypothetical protein